MRKYIDLTGQKFGRLTVLEPLPTYKGKVWWKCRCDCGVVKNVESQPLRSGRTKSCGCLNAERTRNAKYRLTHGMTGRRVYNCWQNMKIRCNNPKTSGYHNYGGRGIKVCRRWLKFENFYADMGDPPSPKHSLDRIDVNGNYCKRNCRWATSTEQCNNKRDNVVLTYRGKTMSVADWARHLSIPKGTIFTRLSYKLPIETVLSKGRLPKRKHKLDR